MKILKKCVDHPLKILLIIVIVFIGFEVCYQIIGTKKYNYGLENIGYLNQLQAFEPEIKYADLVWWHDFIERNSYDNPADSLTEFIGAILRRYTKKELRRPHGYVPYSFNSTEKSIRMNFRVFLVYNRTRNIGDTVDHILNSEPPKAIRDLEQRCKTINRNEARVLPRVTGMFWWPKFEEKKVKNEYDYFWCSDIKSYLSFKYYRSSNPMKVFMWYLPEN